jgi:hypothetical protein
MHCILGKFHNGSYDFKTNIFLGASSEDVCI